MAHQVIVICSPDDTASRKDLDRAVAMQKRSGLVALRNAADFPDDAALTAAIDDADIVIVLLTRALVTSPLWAGVALQAAEAASRQHQIPVIPLVVEPCDYRSTWLGMVQSLPRGGKALSQQRDSGAAWDEITMELSRVFKSRTPRPRAAVAAAEAAAQSATPAQSAAPTQSAATALDLSSLADTYRALGRYHDALTRLVDAASRTVESIVGTLRERSWSPGELYRPARPAPSERGTVHIPLQRVSYTWATAPWLTTGACRVILVHDGDGASSASAAGSPARALLSVFATRALDVPSNPDLPPPDWSDADACIAASAELSPASWQDSEAHLASGSLGTFRFGGFTEDVSRAFATPAAEAWLARLSRLVTAVKADSLH